MNSDIEAENEEDSAMYDDVDEIVDGQSGGASTKGSINQGNKADGNFRVAPEDRVAPADREELDDEYDEEAGQGFPSRANIRIERPGKGALAIEATIQDGDIIIEDVAHFANSELADPKTAEQNWSRQALYTGPHFNQLDEDLQILLEKFIEERGINTRMALFIPDYIDHKEQKEYIRWLKSESFPDFLVSMPMLI
jgi:complement component 1 Q subcomponent-binding protein